MSAPRAPVVLAHGLLGFSQIAVRRMRLATYFRGIPEHLTALGCRVIVPQVPGRASIAERAGRLRDAVRAEAGAGPVHVIAHSMGGLDARHAIAHLGLDAQALALVTIGTPHRGSPVADFVHGAAERIGVLDLLRRSEIEHTALLDLRTDACAHWSAATPDSPRVRYLSVAGVTPRDRVIAALRPAHDLVAAREGPNDGLVSAKSAAWGEVLPAWACDHVNEVGWWGPRALERGAAIDVRPHYARLASLLAEVER